MAISVRRSHSSTRELVRLSSTVPFRSTNAEGRRTWRDACVTEQSVTVHVTPVLGMLTLGDVVVLCNKADIRIKFQGLPLTFLQRGFCGQPCLTRGKDANPPAQGPASGQHQIEISPPPTKATKRLAYVTGDVIGSLGAAQLGEEDAEEGGFCLWNRKVRLSHQYFLDLVAELQKVAELRQLRNSILLQQ
jgi:hypothetical protein